jgi:hypothetical protein
MTKSEFYKISVGDILYYPWLDESRNLLKLCVKEIRNHSGKRKIEVLATYQEGNKLIEATEHYDEYAHHSLFKSPLDAFSKYYSDNENV